MAIDLEATNKLAQNPAAFLRENYVRVLGGLGAVAAAANTTGKAAANIRHKQINVVGGVARANAAATITNSDLITIQDYNNSDKIYFRLDKISDAYYEANLQLNNANGAKPCHFVKYRSNQITAFRIPKAGLAGPSVFMTDTLTGCSVYVLDGPGRYIMLHANAIGILTAQRQRYMDDLCQQYMAGTNLRLAYKLTPAHYRLQDWSMQMKARSDKLKLGRDEDGLRIDSSSTNAFGVKIGGNWKFGYQSKVNVKSDRKGLKKAFNGKTSRKHRIEFNWMPDA